MAILSMSATAVSPHLSPCGAAKPGSYIVCRSDFAATTIQSLARVYLAKKEWELLYVRHIEDQILRLRYEHKARAKRARKKKILDRTATIIQTLVRGYIVRKQYRESDRLLRGAESGLSLMESVRKRMDIRLRIESIKQQISEVRQARNTCADSDDDENDRESNNSQDEVSIRKVEELKATKHKLNIKAKTLEAVTRPLQEKFVGLRAEHEKLMKKYGKIESKNESSKYANKTKLELLAQKRKQIEDARDELAVSLSGESIDTFCRDRSKAQKRLDTLVETSSAYARLGMSDRDAAAFAGEVVRIGKEAHRKAKIFRDSLRSHMPSNLTKSRSSSSLMSDTVDTSAAVVTPTSTRTVVAPTRKKTDSTSSFQSTEGVRPTKRGHGRGLRNLLQDRSPRSVLEQNRSLSATLQRQDSNSDEQHQPEILRKGKRYFVKREKSQTGLLKRQQSHSRTPSPRRHERIFVKRDRTRAPSPRTPNTPEANDKMKIKGRTAVTPVIGEKMKLSSTSPKISNSFSSNKQTPKISNVSNGHRPMRRTHSETNTPISEMKREFMGSEDKNSPPRSPLSKNLKESKGRRKSRSKSKDRNGKRKEKVRKPEGSNSRSPSHRRSNSRSNSRRNSHSNSRRSNSNSRGRSHDNRDEDACERGLLRRKRQSNVPKNEKEVTPEQPRRHVSLTARKIDVRKNNRTYSRRATSLTESAKNRRKFVDERIDSGGMMPHLV